MCILVKESEKESQLEIQKMGEHKGLSKVYDLHFLTISILRVANSISSPKREFFREIILKLSLEFLLLVQSMVKLVEYIKDKNRIGNISNQSWIQI